MQKKPKTKVDIRIVKGAGSEHAYRALKKEIVSFALTPGEDLDEASLVARLGLSRTPVREAIVRLAGEGLVQLVPNRGARVAPMSWNDIREHLEAFDLHQRLVTRWAAIRRSDAQLTLMEKERVAFDDALARGDSEAMLDTNWRFHAAVAASCRNGIVQRFYLQLLTANLRIARLAMTFECFPGNDAYRAHVGQIAHEHTDMVQAIRERDADRAEALAQSHAGLARKRVSESLTESITPEMMISLAGSPAVAA